jgi:hypothetical protein
MNIAVLILLIGQGCSQSIQSTVLTKEYSHLLSDAVEAEKKAGTDLPAFWSEPQFIEQAQKELTDLERNPFLVTNDEERQFAEGKFDDANAAANIKQMLDKFDNSTYKPAWFDHYLIEQFEADNLHGAQLEVCRRILARRTVEKTNNQLNDKKPAKEAIRKAESTSGKKFPKPTIKVSCKYLHANAEIAYDMIMSIWPRIIGMEGMTKFICVCNDAGVAEIYFFGEPNIDVSNFSVLIKDRVMPTDSVSSDWAENIGIDAEKPVIENVSGKPFTIPGILDIHIIDSVHVNLDRTKMADYGIRTETARDAIEKAFKSNSFDEYTIETSTGEKIKLSDFTTRTNHRVPDLIIRLRRM